MADLPDGRPDGRAPRRHWYSTAPAPELPPVSTKRAYIEVLGVFAAFFLAGVVSAALLLGGRFRDDLVNGSWSLYGTQAIEVVAQIGLAVTVVLLLGQKRGVTARTLGLFLPRQEDGRVAAGRITRMLAWALFALILGGIINALLQTGHLPEAKPNAPELVYAVSASVQAGIVEELVVLAFVVVTLRQARRPWWEVALVALVLRGSYHIYYGPGVVGILVWAALFYWIYLRMQSLVPLIVAHAMWDSVIFISQRWGFVVGFAILAVIGLWIAAPITWLVERSDRTHRSHPVGGTWTPAWVPPGWHPDPAGLNQWRWWDGYRWTDHVSGAG